MIPRAPRRLVLFFKLFAMGVSFRMYFALFFSISRVASVCASGFLARMPEPDVRRLLLDRLEASFAGNLSGIRGQRLADIEDVLRLPFDVLPKNKDDRLDHDAVRYLMNRFFTEQHGWSITNFQVGSVASSTSPTAASASDRLPDILQELFETLISSSGANFKEVVALAATLEHLIREDLRGKLVDVYQAQNISTQEGVDKTTALNLMDLHMMCVIRGEDTQDCLTRGSYLLRNFHSVFPLWKDVKQLIREALGGFPAGSANRTFDDVTDALEVVADRFASLYEKTCQSLKSTLIDMEDRRSGRVRLVDLYKTALKKDLMNLAEPIELLRDSGALDESDAETPRVIIPNYVNGMSNCIARTSFYSTCCRSACASILAKVEHQLGRAEASPADIVSVVNGLDAPWGSEGIPPLLLKRLNDVAKHHGGSSVPIHGRLFMQWMHFVYPRDCPFPHLSGSTYKKTLEAWIDEMGQDAQYTRLELRRATERLFEHGPHSDVATASQSAAAGDDSGSNEVSCMWSLDEELVVGRSDEDDLFERHRAFMQWPGGTLTATFLLALAVVVSLQLCAPASEKQKRTSSLPREEEPAIAYCC